jgi:putative transposase
VFKQEHERTTPVTQLQFDPSELLDAIVERPEGDLVRRLAEFMFQELIETEATARIGAERHERTATRSTRRNGHRPRRLSTKAGDLSLRIPKLREGSFFPSILERRRLIDDALYAVVMEAYVHGVSTRKVDDLVRALGCDSGISKSEVSRICSEMDSILAAFRDRELEEPFCYLFLDATYLKGRVGRRVTSRAVVVATAVSMAGRREVLGLMVGNSEDEAFWGEFLSSLKDRGLNGVRLVISDHHAGLKAAVARHLQGASWQRCRVHFMRNVLARVPKHSGDMVMALIRTVFAQPDAEHVERQLAEVVDRLGATFPEVASMLADAAEDLTAFRHFPQAHWRRVWSTNPLERLNAEIKRRTRVVGIFPNDASILRLVSAVCLEVHEEWEVDERRYFSEESMASLRDGVTPALQAVS